MTEINEAREEMKHLALQFGHNYHDILDRLNETGDFQEANKADEAFIDQILNLKWPDGSRMIGVISKEQSLPYCPSKIMDFPSKKYWYFQAQEDMSDFRRLAKEE